MNILQGYINYGCLGSEKRRIFTAEQPEATAVVSEKVEYILPKEWELYETIVGSIAVLSPWGQRFLPNDILAGDEYPCFLGYDKHGYYFCHRLKYQKV